MSGYLPPHIDKGTNNLNEQRCRYDIAHEMRNMQIVHAVHTHEIAEDTYHIWYHTTLLAAKLNQAPSLISTIKMYQNSRQKDSKQIDHDEKL
jgi:hypothetical protein